VIYSAMRSMKNVSDKFLVLRIAEGIGYPDERPIVFERICDTESEAIEIASNYPLAFVQAVKMVSHPLVGSVLDRQLDL
jgi:hypothetical protein